MFSINKTISAGDNYSQKITLPITYTDFINGISCNTSTNCITNFRNVSLSKIEVVTRNINNRDSASPDKARYITIGV